MRVKDCYNFDDFRKFAKSKLPAPIFHYIDGGADDEVTLNRNTDAFNDCDLVPSILNSVGEPDLSTEIFGRKIDMPIFLSPTAMQSLYHPEGDKASARAAANFNTMYSMSTMASFSIEEVANISSGPKLFQLYIHKDQSITEEEEPEVGKLDVMLESMNSDENEDDLEDWQEPDPNRRLPLVCLILQFDQICTRKLLEYHIHWFETLPWSTLASTTSGDGKSESAVNKQRKTIMKVDGKEIKAILEFNF